MIQYVFLESHQDKEYHTSNERDGEPLIKAIIIGVSAGVEGVRNEAGKRTITGSPC